MPVDHIRSTRLVPGQFAEYERVAWFLLGHIERERRLYLEALFATPPIVTMTLIATPPVFLLPLSWLAIAGAKR